MTKSWLITTDVHGSLKTLLSLVEKYGKNRQLILLGDEIDRGLNSRGVVEYAMDNDIPTCLGNHEDLCLAYSAHAKMGYKSKCSLYYERDIWLYNGGDVALDSWGGKIPKKVLDWMSNLPPYIILDKEVKGRKCLLSHTGYGLDADKNNWMRALWGRYSDDGDFTHGKDGKPVDDGYFRVFGHTRTNKIEIHPTFVNIDSGCAYKGYGKLTGFLWPEMEIVQVDNID